MNSDLERFERAHEPIWTRFARSTRTERAPQPGHVRHRSGSALVRILEDERQIVLECDVDGFEPDDIDIALSGQDLSICLGRPTPVEDCFTLPRAIDTRGAKAELEGSQLRVILPLRSASRGLGILGHRRM